MDMDIEVTVKVSTQRISDMFVGMIEGNFMTRSWVQGIGVSDEQDEKFPNWWYATPEFFEQPDYKIEITYADGKKREGIFNRKMIITPKKVKAGLQLMAKKFPRHFSDMIEEKDDNITQDVLLQCIVLKDIVFG